MGAELDDKRQKLIDAAFAHVHWLTDATIRGLCDAASHYAKARLDAAPQKMRQQTNGFRLAFGKHKGSTLGECPKEYLEWLGNATSEGLDDPANREKNQQLLDLITAELGSR